MHLFNNDNKHWPQNSSRGNLIKIDTAAKRATSVQVFEDTRDIIQSISMGNYQALSNGNVLLYYGNQPIAKEFGPEGDVRLAYQFGPYKHPYGPGYASYRLYKSEWKGCPDTRPKVKACKNGDGNMDVYMSWNGATEVRHWNVYSEYKSFTGPIKGGITKTGFETKAVVPVLNYIFVQAEAVGGCQGWNETRRSRTVKIVDQC